MSDPFVGQITMLGFNWAPSGWAFCNGQSLPVMQNQVLYALIGNLYGGNQTAFNLPNLQGRLPLHFGVNGSTSYPIASFAGNSTAQVNTTTSFTLNANSLPAHTHAATLNLPAFSAATNISVSSSTASGQVMAPAAGSTLTNSPGGQLGAAIYLPAGTPQNTPVNLGGVTTTVTPSGAGSVTNASTGSGAAVVAPLSFAVPTMSPYLAVNFCIALIGLFPSRN